MGLLPGLLVAGCRVDLGLEAGLGEGGGDGVGERDIIGEVREWGEGDRRRALREVMCRTWSMDSDNRSASRASVWYSAFA